MAEYIEKWPVVNRLIDLENEFQQYKPFHGFEHAMYRKICEVEIVIGKTPDADVAPVIHAHWVSASKKQGVNIGMKCSLCGARIKNSEFFNGNHNYCHKCGAQMDEPVGNSNRLEDDER